MKNRKKFLIIVIIVLAVIGVSSPFLIKEYNEKKPYSKIVVEAGKPMVDPDVMFKNAGNCGFIRNNVDVSVLGSYNIIVKNGLFIYFTTVEVVDTVAPIVECDEVVNVKIGEKISANDAIAKVTDATETEATFLNEIKWDEYGHNDISISVKDSGGNETIVDTKIHIVDPIVKEKVTIEAGQKLEESMFFVDGEIPKIKHRFVKPLDEINVSRAGTFKVGMRMHKDKYTIELEILDNLPPKATVVSKRIRTIDELNAEDIVYNIEDSSDTTVEFVKKPDTSKVGEYKVNVVIKDSYNHQSEYEATIYVEEDRITPEIYGVKDRVMHMGENKTLLEDVVAIDNYDGNLIVGLDDSNVDYHKTGTYDATYFAIDKMGNRASRNFKVAILPPRNFDELFNEKVDNLLDSITTKGMSDLEKAKAIYDWANSNIVYVGSSNKLDWRKEAFNGITYRKGDCYTYFAVSKALLTAAGIENMDIERSKDSPRTTRHYWNLVNLGDGWYHFDTCSRSVPFDGFMFTCDMAKEYNTKVEGYYVFDEEQYPKIN